MPSAALDRLAEAHGVAVSYISEVGGKRLVGDATKRKLLEALGVPASGAAAIEASLAALAADSSQQDSLRAKRAFMPAWLESQRTWGITCQLYGLRSSRNWGMGDFEDLAQLAELGARRGADFIGVNPLHALFLAAPARFSPYSPSSRRFLNPLYIAVDRLEGGAPCRPADVDVLRHAELVDYVGATALKRDAFISAFAHFQKCHLDSGSHPDVAFRSFRVAQGSSLKNFALFETLSAYFLSQGLSVGWQDWPKHYKDSSSAAVATFRERHEKPILFHEWLQWVAATQLAEAQQRARAAGMRIGLYLDLAVGVAPDGADTWCAPDQVITGARIGAPPDYFNATGQDWGLAPLSPKRIREGKTDGLRAVLDAAMRYAGAIRLDHVMGLRRLFLIPQGLASSDGTYVDYPLDAQLDVVAAASRESRAVVIGEDLGTVPAGFRNTMRKANIQGYRVLLFERSDDHAFHPPAAYDHSALACVSTHDLPTLAGWWHSVDIAERLKIGHLAYQDEDATRALRLADRRALTAALDHEVLLPAAYRNLADPDASLPDQLDDTLAVATHRFLARTPCRLVAVQLADLVCSEDCINIPGTTDGYPNWRQKLPVELEQLETCARFDAICRAMSEERPRTR